MTVEIQNGKIKFLNCSTEIWQVKAEIESVISNLVNKIKTDLVSKDSILKLLSP